MIIKSENILSAAIFTLLFAFAITACLWWLSHGPNMEFKTRVASIESMMAPKHESVDIKGKFLKFEEPPPSPTSYNWPNFRGADCDNINKETIRLADKWPESGPPVKWSVDLGEGYAGPVVMNGRVYLLDYDEKETADSLRCFSFDTGKELWRRWYKVKIKRNHGMSRTVPAVTDKYVVTIGPRCQVMCVKADDGTFLWGNDLTETFKTKVPLWYTGQCPVIDNDVAVIAPGGDALMVGLDCATGDVVWRTPNPKGWQMSHSSIMSMTFDGKKMYVYCAEGGMVGVSAEKDDAGSLLWETTEWNHSVMAPSPIHMGNGKIFITAGYGVGSMMLQLSKTSEGYSIKPTKRFDRKEFACEQHTPIYYDNHLFTVMPADAGDLKLQARCIDAEGNEKWNSGKEHRFGIGPYIVADGKMFILSSEGDLTMIKADTREYTQLAQHKALEGPDAWGPMAIVNGKMLLRDFRRMICIDLSER